MKSFILLISLVVLSACGSGYTAVIAPPPCTVAATATGSQITCPDGTTQSVTNGATGSQGVSGSIGATGAAGQNGSSCSVATLAVGSVAAPNGGSLITCPGGTSSIVLNGSPGAVGASGSQGVAGTPGTVITPIQFCAGFTQSYPNTFAESGICVNNQILGVYSENGGFLAELPPGEYSSDGINSSCTFTIEANCKVTQ